MSLPRNMEKETRQTLQHLEEIFADCISADTQGWDEFVTRLNKPFPFPENPKTGDCRISGTGASLAGLEKAIQEEGPHEVELAIRRLLLIHGVILTAGGIPLIDLSDEIGTLNDYSYRDHADHARFHANTCREKSCHPGKFFRTSTNRSCACHQPVFHSGQNDIAWSE